MDENFPTRYYIIEVKTVCNWHKDNEADRTGQEA